MTDLSIYSQEFTIGSFDTDWHGNAKLTSICNYLQEIAGNHVDQIGQGLDDLNHDNHAWVLSRIRIKIKRPAKWKETIRIETFPTGIKSLFGARDFRIFDAENKIIAIASSYWLVVDLNSHRPIRPHDVVKNMPIGNYSEVFEKELGKLPPLSSDAELIEEIKIHYSDIDINRHVNNVKYLKWIIDAIPAETLTEKPISELEINFLHELKLGEQIQIFQELDDEYHLSCKITSKTTGKENCRAKISLNNLK
ncbi:medium-chain acyl-[acyl-carrier-protein] hydrolase [Ancylomarina subtilis]|uniref:Medium-chain acyl-[acyl-carrier-protein] hydrolase n=1 Tax=Ancylomarina subtilis TaxID=1639035 RepID=A0A4Q7VHP5_9BACT|nr:acyl-ACP thioesterase domain-containing protein [Ancylomarina subtilis]RZT95609.1 medium-chain acyl-[acyl-carrier-protein] hydrolase [Ancylomarina subtilis]